MVIIHLTDDEVQQYVVDRQHCEVKIVEHIHFCEVCRAKVEVYQMMIKGIKQQPQPAFGELVRRGCVVRPRWCGLIDAMPHLPADKTFGHF